MPFYLEERDVSSDLSDVKSVLIVPCRFCPAASLAVREKKPYLRLFRAFLRTPAYEAYVRGLKRSLEEAGVRADVFDSTWPHHFVACMWPSGRRRELERRAPDYDAVIVLGCDAAVKTAQDCTRSAGCRVIPGMEVDGIMNVIPSFRFPGDISLEVTGVIRVLEHRSGTAEQEMAPDATPPRC